MTKVYKFFKARNFNAHCFTFRPFIAHSENVLVDPNLEHEERLILEEYKGRLKVDGDVIPDPMALKTGWVGEKNGVSKWPSIFYNDIANYLKKFGPDFINHLDREYKLGKAYRYFADNFIREIYYHKISEKSKYCILKCRVFPSQKVSSWCHDKNTLWSRYLITSTSLALYLFLLGWFKLNLTLLLDYLRLA